MTILRIITHNSPGLLNDAKIYKKIFKKNKINTSLLITDLENNKTNKFYDINLFLEIIGEQNITMTYPSKLNLYMPNQEIFYKSFDQIKNIDYVLCKTKICFLFFSKMKSEHNFKYVCLYTKFTTYIPKELRNTKKITDKNLFVHLAGKSPLKNTPDLIYYWLKNDGFLNIDSHIRLNITCYKKCIKSAFKVLKKYYHFDLKKEYNITLDTTQNIIHIKNMTIYISISPYEDYIKMLTTANLAICISSKEGYGHYINEARFFKTCIMILDVPPMNELVKDNVNGILIKNPILEISKSSLRYTTYKLFSAFPNGENLKNKIIYCIKNKDKLFKMGICGNEMFLKDKEYFENKMTNIIQNRITKYLNN